MVAAARSGRPSKRLSRSLAPSQTPLSALVVISQRWSRLIIGLQSPSAGQGQGVEKKIREGETTGPTYIYIFFFCQDQSNGFFYFGLSLNNCLRETLTNFTTVRTAKAVLLKLGDLKFITLFFFGGGGEGWNICIYLLYLQMCPWKGKKSQLFSIIEKNIWKNKHRWCSFQYRLLKRTCASRIIIPDIDLLRKNIQARRIFKMCTVILSRLLPIRFIRIYAYSKFENYYKVFPKEYVFAIHSLRV